MHCCFNIMNNNRLQTWIVDTGATDHMCCDLSLFYAIPISVNVIIRLPNNNSTVATHMGDIHISPDFILKNVLYVPSFTYNLMSISSLTQKSFCNVLFTADKCLFFSAKGFNLQDPLSFREIGHAGQRDGLYHFKFSTIVSNVQFSAVNSVKSDVKLWHSRLGHASFKCISLISDLKIPCKQHEHCTICHFSRHKRTPFPIST